MVGAGVFAPGARLELLEGEIINMTPQRSRHATAVRLVEDALRTAFGTGFDVRTQLPLSLGDFSEPEPDVAVVKGNPRDYRDAHPASAVLVVEVSETTLDYDRRRKLPIYARAGISEYWILDVESESLEVYREPTGDSYGQRQVLRAGDFANLPGGLAGAIPVSDILP
jgi:Uma2 family endonuclease